MGKNRYPHSIWIEERKTANAHWFILYWLNDDAALIYGSRMKVIDAFGETNVHGKPWRQSRRFCSVTVKRHLLLRISWRRKHKHTALVHNDLESKQVLVKGSAGGQVQGSDIRNSSYNSHGTFLL